MSSEGLQPSAEGVWAKYHRRMCPSLLHPLLAATGAGSDPLIWQMHGIVDDSLICSKAMHLSSMCVCFSTTENASRDDMIEKAAQCPQRKVGALNSLIKGFAKAYSSVAFRYKSAALQRT